MRGGGFFTGCEDVLVNGEPVEASRPEKGIEIRLRQGSREWRLGTVDAREDYSFVARLLVPEGARPGEATVIAGDARTSLRITSG